MLFNLESDNGRVIKGYLVPDGFSDQPSIRIVVKGREDIVMECGDVREAVVASGRHATGTIGFRLDETIVQGIETMRHIAIYDVKTGLLVYRRPPSDKIIPKRVLRLETQMIPLARLDVALDPHFHYAIRAVERFGHETAMQAFHLNGVKSIYISGRILLRNYEEFLDKGFEVVTQIADPYEEMAERLMLIKRFDKLPPALLGERDRMLLAPAALHFADVDIFWPRELTRALALAPENVQRYLSSPVTRQLVATHPEQVPTRQSLAAAMDSLSRFAVVGLKSQAGTFAEPLEEFLDVKPDINWHSPRGGLTHELTTLLKNLPVAERLAEFDLILYHFIRQAVALHHENTVDAASH